MRFSLFLPHLASPAPLYARWRDFCHSDFGPFPPRFHPVLYPTVYCFAPTTPHFPPTTSCHTQGFAVLSHLLAPLKMVCHLFLRHHRQAHIQTAAHVCLDEIGRASCRERC